MINVLIFQSHRVYVDTNALQQKAARTTDRICTQNEMYILPHVPDGAQIPHYSCRLIIVIVCSVLQHVNVSRLLFLLLELVSHTYCCYTRV